MNCPRHQYFIHLAFLFSCCLWKLNYKHSDTPRNERDNDCFRNKWGKSPSGTSWDLTSLLEEFQLGRNPSPTKERLGKADPQSRQPSAAVSSAPWSTSSVWDLGDCSVFWVLVLQSQCRLEHQSLALARLFIPLFLLLLVGSCFAATCCTTIRLCLCSALSHKHKSTEEPRACVPVFTWTLMFFCFFFYAFLLDQGIRWFVQLLPNTHVFPFRLCFSSFISRDGWCLFFTSVHNERFLPSTCWQCCSL